LNARAVTAVVSLGLLVAACGAPVEESPADDVPPPPPPAPVTPATITGIYWGFYTFALGPDGEFSGFSFGNPVIIDGAGRAMWLANVQSTEGFLFDAVFQKSGEGLAADVTVRRIPTDVRWTGLAVGTLDADGDLDVPDFPVSEGAEQRATFGIDEGSVDQEATALDVELAELDGHYVTTGGVAIGGSFDSDFNRFEMDISSGGAVSLGGCWRGQLELVEAGKPVVRVLDASPLCPTDEHLSGLMAVFEDQLYVLLVDEGGDRSYSAYFPR
jgi:hypothetical protein